MRSSARPWHTAYDPGVPATLPNPAVPLFSLLDATANTGITLTESYAMLPPAAVSGW